MKARRYTLAACLALVGCGASEPRFELSDGTSVTVRENGAFALFAADGRLLLETSAAHAPTARTFTESWLGALAIYTFRREDEVAIALDAMISAERAGDGVAITYAGEGGATGTLTIAPDGDEATRVSFALSLAGARPDSVTLPIRCTEESTFYGFGAQYNATNQRGNSFPLIVGEQGIGRHGGPRGLTGDEHTTYFPMPYYLDARGFGVLIETDYRVEVDLCRREVEAAAFEVVSGEPLELVVFHGPTMPEVIRQLGDRVGRPALPPSWAFELWVSSQGGRDAVLADVAALEAADIPVGVIWSQDWSGERINFDGGKGVEYRWVADEERYPDLAGMIAELRDRGIRFLAYANPFVDPALPNHFDEMDAAGLLIRDASGQTYVHTAPSGRASMPDFTNPTTRAYVGAAFRAMVEDHGIDGFMADFGEWLPLDAKLRDGSDPRAYHNRYPIDWHRSWREAMDEVRPDGDYVVFARSGWTGVHEVSQIHWIGDQETSWSEHDGLPTVVPALINLGLSGIPYVTHDIGGFGGFEGQRSKELFLRWTELGAFTPIMRTHEGAFRDENWDWHSDAETTAHFRRFARIHAALGDELRELAAEAQRTSMPILRHMMLEFPGDPMALELSDQFMLGPDLLVAPVVEEGATERELYLPEGDWYHVLSGERYVGGERIIVPAPIGEPPVFSRERDRPDLRAID
jgi:sulfoquinovosidase